MNDENKMAELEANMELWWAVNKTDPLYTKKSTQKGGFTSISPQYVLQKATQIFGPYGVGFGLAISNFNLEMVEQTGMVIHQAVFFYHLKGGERVEFPIHNAIKAWTLTKEGAIYSDPDFAKKLETNTISKALSKIGVCADVYLGEFDDHQYVEAAMVEAQIERADKQDEEREKAAAELQEWFERNLAAMKNAVTLPELQGLYKAMVRRLNHWGRMDLIQTATAIKDQEKARLEEKNDE